MAPRRCAVTYQPHVMAVRQPRRQCLDCRQSPRLRPLLHALRAYGRVRHTGRRRYPVHRIVVVRRDMQQGRRHLARLRARGVPAHTHRVSQSAALRTPYTGCSRVTYLVSKNKRLVHRNTRLLP